MSSKLSIEWVNSYVSCNNDTNVYLLQNQISSKLSIEYA